MLRVVELDVNGGNLALIGGEALESVLGGEECGELAAFINAGDAPVVVEDLDVVARVDLQLVLFGVVFVDDDVVRAALKGPPWKEFEAALDGVARVRQVLAILSIWENRRPGWC